MTSATDKLQSIDTLDALVDYLRDEMGWPIESDAENPFEDIAFEYTPEELGIDESNAAKIETIKRMRPLTVNQPWGVFFVEFEPKRLPVTALRRILNEVITKKRASATSADRVTWDMDDIMFISGMGGDGESRKMTFAHFSEGDESRLPSLKVIAWDDKDTPLAIQSVVEKLTEKLAWPDDEEDTAAWREAWSSAFTLRHREVITTSQKLAVALAELARDIRDRILETIQIESAEGPVTQLMGAFRKTLIHDLEADDFADMYAQTIAYGLLSARIVNPGRNADDSSLGLPVTNPFLRELMENFLRVGTTAQVESSGIDFDELGVNEVIDLLDEANMPAVVADFGDRNPEEDPVIHFYERFLAAFDPDVRMQRGVFYTPRPVVSFIVRSVDELLRTQLQLKDGLADTTTWGDMGDRLGISLPEGVDRDDPFVRILDPATGTGTFLVEAIDVIHRTMVAKWASDPNSKSRSEQLWNEYVSKHLLPRLFGYELLMAPYVIAHLKIGLKLAETGYRFETDQRVNLYLTNALEGAGELDLQLELELPALAHEASAVAQAKQSVRFTAVLGNPPYAYMSANLTEEARELVEPFRSINGEPVVEKNAIGLERTLQDDYVKFIALAMGLLADSRAGVIGLITNNTYLENINLRGLRHALWSSAQLWLLDLHGDAGQREVDELGLPDQNVFDIRKGVGVLLASRGSQAKNDLVPPFRSDLRGSRSDKYRRMLDRTWKPNWQPVAPRPPMYRFVFVDEAVERAWEAGVPLDRVFLAGASGVETGKDDILVALTDDELRDRLSRISDPAADTASLVEEFNAHKGHGSRIMRRRTEIDIQDTDRDKIISFCFTPFDTRALFYRPDLIQVHSEKVARHLLEPENFAFVYMRQVVLDRPFSHIFVSGEVVNNRAFYSTRGKAVMSPVWADSPIGLPLLNVDEAVLATVAGPVGSDVLSALGLVYAQLHSTEYRSQFDSQLRRGYPRVFRPLSDALLFELAHLGSELIRVHLEPSGLDETSVERYRGPSGPVVGAFAWTDSTLHLDTRAASGACFLDVPKDVWEYEIGGYQVLKKWFSARRHRTLGISDVAAIESIIRALTETVRLTTRIDTAIADAGGWKSAFDTSLTHAQ